MIFHQGMPQYLPYYTNSFIMLRFRHPPTGAHDPTCRFHAAKIQTAM